MTSTGACGTSVEQLRKHCGTVPRSFHILSTVVKSLYARTRGGYRITTTIKDHDHVGVALTAVHFEAVKWRNEICHV